MLKKLLKIILPKTLKNKFIEINNNYFDGYALKSYSQEGEDMILRRLFEKQRTGFYVDVGAHHPKRFSNTYFFYKQGWHGINIDAMPGSMKLFEKIRPRDINIEKPISEKKQILTYYAFNEPALNGFSKELSEERNGKENYFIEFTQDIETATLEEILENNLPKNQDIDFLSIDVEGLDFMVLQSNNFQKYKPKVILIEILGSSLSDIQNNEISKYLKNFNYSIYAKAVNTIIFIKDEFYQLRYSK
ncbi:MAG: FkbM family methyltransferase [Campylobacterales bacterium]|nr:FkbM family methyltransferase [Campylobacterales bacterium]HEO98699.1 FkbM family methyltransferase [Campylobacterota bacterium]